MNSKSIKKILIHIIYLYASSMMSFMFFRIIFYISNYSKMSLDYDNIFYLTVRAFFKGMQFDSATLGYIFLPYTVLLAIFTLLNLKKKILYKLLFFISIFAISLMIFGSSVDIILFEEYGRKLDTSWFKWIGNDTAGVVSMIFSSFNLWWTILPFIAVIFFYIKMNTKIFNTNVLNNNIEQNIKFHLIYSLIFLLAGGVVGDAMMKGRFRFYEKRYELWYMYPHLTYIKAETHALNSVALNPAFNFFDDIKKNKYYRLMDRDMAIKNTAIFMDRKFKDGYFYQQNTYTSEPKKENIVVIIMESMGNSNLKYYGNNSNITPFLDSLILNSLFFENSYSYSIGTNQGVHAIMSGLLTPYEFINTKNIEAFSYYKKVSLVSELKKNDYNTLFFIPHSESFDNMRMYIENIGIDSVYYSEKDYGDNINLAFSGIEDKFLFNFGMSKINKISEQENPFFATFLTLSNHAPYIISKKYTAKYKDKTLKELAVLYADNSLNDFFKQASKQKWYDNTLFVLVGDHDSHGIVGYKKNRVPIIFFKKGIKPKITSDLIMQTDILPSVMGYLNIDFENKTFGRDIFSQKRNYALLDNSGKYMVANKDFFISEKYDKTNFDVFNLKEEKINIKTLDKKEIEHMKQYAYSLLQVTQMINTNKIK